MGLGQEKINRKEESKKQIMDLVRGELPNAHQKKHLQIVESPKAAGGPGSGSLHTHYGGFPSARGGKVDQPSQTAMASPILVERRIEEEEEAYSEPKRGFHSVSPPLRGGVRKESGVKGLEKRGGGGGGGMKFVSEAGVPARGLAYAGGMEFSLDLNDQWQKLVN